MGKQNVKPESPTPKRIYVALVGLNYGCTGDDPRGTRVEAGEEVPAAVVTASPWLLEQGLVREEANG